MGELIIRHADHCTRVGPFRLTRGGLEVDSDATLDQWVECGTFLRRAEEAVQWWIGDWLNYGERKYGEKYAQAVEITGLDYKTLRNVKTISGQYELSRRRDNLPFTAHAEVASLPPHVADELLARAEGQQLSSRRLRALARQAKLTGGVSDEPLLPAHTAVGRDMDALSSLVTRGQKFGTIYVDPPWPYRNQATRGSTCDHYETMLMDDIAALPVGDLAAPRSHLWLWTTNGFLFDCPRLFEAWGFEFKCSYAWVKPQMGMGNYLRNSHELLLLAIRGGLRGAARNVMSWGSFKRGRHSAKPDEVRTGVVEKLSPGPRLELFGRQVVPGWVVWGRQIPRDIFDASVENLGAATDTA